MKFKIEVKRMREVVLSGVFEVFKIKDEDAARIAFHLERALNSVDDHNNEFYVLRTHVEEL